MSNFSKKVIGVFWNFIRPSTHWTHKYSLLPRTILDTRYMKKSPPIYIMYIYICTAITSTIVCSFSLSWWCLLLLFTICLFCNCIHYSINRWDIFKRWLRRKVELIFGRWTYLEISWTTFLFCSLINILQSQSKQDLNCRSV